MRLPIALARLALLAAAPALTLAAQPPGARGATRVEPGAPCPAGTTEIRPNLCQAPELPAPSILDYRPRSTLVTTEHRVPRPKYPAVDYHGHPGAVDTPEALQRLVAQMDSLGLGVMVTANNTSGEALKRAVAAIRASPAARDRVRVLTGIDFRNVGPGWAEKAVAQLEADAAAGAVGVGEIGKGLGLSTKKADGTRLKLDDPALDPVWQAAARLRLPVFVHTADPQEFWQPIDYTNERWLELALFPGRRYPGDQFPSFEQLMQERDAMLRRNPRTTFVIAHMGWHANDLPRLAKLMTELPNVHTEVGAVLYDLGRQPRAARDFLVRFQDRVLFGKDSFQPEEYPYYWRVFETRDDYFDYYRPYHAFWKLYGLDLPDATLRKLYYENAQRISPGIPKRR
ncbi:amidohydrolase family protein [Roseisolibacter sp. H3M3-2]|uniref:amidohydrolase family protein n=1 Tax=Roseisolibacter sp. H3M3-2 TaxID=3031323 RepID=UPI0023DB89AD|nr:amidohydrolase family protein [Roseisolibacter sp. H3M3-2]MDF1502594.1 amidohydrolase family protein [Roseisolibacter sp. H3M3-2]